MNMRVRIAILAIYITACNGFAITTRRSPLFSSKDNEQLTKATPVLTKVDEFGLKLKPRAITARDEAILNAEDWKKNAWYTFKACSYLSLFIAYRAYRGLFVVLPEVFREVSRKLQTAVDAPFDENPMELKKRTRITVFFLAAILTSIYTLSGAFKVATKFVSTVFETSKVEPAFEAAAEQIEMNEGNLLKVKNVNGSDSFE